MAGTSPAMTVGEERDMSGFVHPEYLVETEWLAQHLDDPDVVVLDCTTHLIPDPKITYQVKPGREDFERAHIKGAQFVDMLRDVSDTSQKLRFMRQSPEEFGTAMRRLGVNNRTRVVSYSTANVWWATRLWWLLHEFGHDNAAVLNGGWQKWQSEGRAIETAAARARPAGDFKVHEVRNLMVGKDEVLRAVGDGAVCTINALAPQQHAGSGGNAYGRPGRIAGSVNLPAAHLLDPATNAFLPADELRKRFEAIGAMDRSVINYCGGGIAASADALVLVMLGHKDVKLYDASLSEWAKDPALPMETD
jgi:thiosulfate/3-mercaptopyruvate sulfurtransferase